jgi:hypothetical protein
LEVAGRIRVLAGDRFELREDVRAAGIDRDAQKALGTWQERQGLEPALLLARVSTLVALNRSGRELIGTDMFRKR